MRPRASTADAETISSIRKRKHTFGGLEEDTDDELDDDERNEIKRGTIKETRKSWKSNPCSPSG